MRTARAAGVLTSRTPRTTLLSFTPQPSSEVFHLFDRVLLLTSGRLIFDGPTDGVGGMSDYFRSVNFPVPPETNPADHVMFLMQTLPQAVRGGRERGGGVDGRGRREKERREGGGGKGLDRERGGW